MHPIYIQRSMNFTLGTFSWFSMNFIISVSWNFHVFWPHQFARYHLSFVKYFFFIFLTESNNTLRSFKNIISILLTNFSLRRCKYILQFILLKGMLNILTKEANKGILFFMAGFRVTLQFLILTESLNFIYSISHHSMLWDGISVKEQHVIIPLLQKLI